MSSLVFLSVLFFLLQHPLPSLSNIEGDVLYAFKQSLSDPNNVLESWDPTLVDPCTWFHITCDSDNHVIRIDLYNYSLGGTLSPELARLPYLQYLELNRNKISGKIPESLGGLRSLVSMDLSHNQLEGNIPGSFGNLVSLKFLWLNDNKLTGYIPRGVIDLNLQVLNVANNPISKPSIDGNFETSPNKN